MKNNGSIDNSIKEKIRIINKDIKIYNTQYKIVNIDKFDLTSNYLIFSGIGNPKSFKKTLLQNKFKISISYIILLLGPFRPQDK